MTGPTVAVVVPCYRYGHYLGRCVGSVLSQVGVDVRVLVIDDASPDDSADVARRLATADPRVEVRVHAANAGHIATYNEGLLGWADADYVALLSADDVLAPGALARAVAVMERHRGVGMVYGHAVEFDDVVPSFAGSQSFFPVVHDGRAWLARRCAEAVNVVPCPGVVVRADVQRAVGGYDPRFPHAGDLHMWLRIAAVADVAYVRGAAQAGYRVHHASMSQHVYQDPLADPSERARVFASFLADVDGGPARGWGTDVRRALADEVMWRACRAVERGAPRDDVDRIEAFGAELDPEVYHRRSYRALQRRRRTGRAAPAVFAGTRAIRRARDELWWRRWRRRGG